MEHKNYSSNEELARKEGFTPLFDTQAILDNKHKTADANVTIPPLNSVQDAKEWVETNEK